MPVQQLPPQQIAKAATESNTESIIEIVKSILPYAIVIGIVLAIIVIAFLMWKKQKEKIDYNKQAYEKLYSQLIINLVDKGLGSLFFTVSFLLLGILLGFFVFDSIFFMAISVLMMFFISKIITTGFSHKFESEIYLYDKDFTKFGVIESFPLYTGDGMQYILITAGKKAMFFPKFKIVALPAQEKYTFSYTTKDGKKKTTKGQIKNFSKILTKNNRGDIMVNCKGFEMHGYYYFPTIELKNDKGTSMFSFRELAFNVNKDLTNEIMVYDLQNENLKNIITAVNTNPLLRLGIKSKDISVEESEPNYSEGGGK